MVSLKANIGYNFTYQLLSLFLPLVTAPYLARTIGAQGIGAYSYSYSIATYFVYFVMLGLNNYGNREIASCQERRIERSKAFWEIYAMQLLCFCLVSICYFVYSLFLAEDCTVAILQGLYVLSSLFDINWFFFGMEQFKLTVIRSAIIKVLTTVLIFVMVHDSGDINLYISIMCSGVLLSQIVLWPFLPRFIDWQKPHLREILPRFKPNIILFASVMAVSVYNVLSNILLGVLDSQQAVGFFDSAAKIVSVPIALIGAIGTVMLPRTSALLAKGETSLASLHIDKTMVAVMAFAGVSAFGIPCIAAPFTELFYGDGFEVAALAMVVLSAKVPLLGFGNVMRTQYLIPNERDSVYLGSALCGAIVSIVTCITLIPLFGVIGAAFASVAAEVAVLMYQMIMCRDAFPAKRYLCIGAVFLICGAIMACCLQALPSTGSAVFDCVLLVSIGAFIYCVLALFAWRKILPRCSN